MASVVTALLLFSGTQTGDSAVTPVTPVTPGIIDVVKKFDYVRARDNRYGESYAKLTAIKNPDVLCGYVVNWGEKYLSARGLPVRGAALWTKHGKAGHTMLEAKVDGKWTLYDVFHGVYMTRGGRPLSLVELIDAIAADAEYEVHPIFPSDNDHLINGDLHSYYKSIAMIGLIRDGSSWYFGDANHRAAAERYANQTLKLPGFYTFDARFMERFYPAHAA